MTTTRANVSRHRACNDRTCPKRPSHEPFFRVMDPVPKRSQERHLLFVQRPFPNRRQILFELLQIRRRRQTNIDMGIVQYESIGIPRRG